MKFLLCVLLAAICSVAFATRVLPTSILEEANQIASLKPEAESLHDPIDSLVQSVTSQASSYNRAIPASLSVLPDLPPADVPMAQATEEQSLAEVAALSSRDHHDLMLDEASRMAERELPAVHEVLDSAKDIDDLHPALAVLGEKVETHTEHRHHRRHRRHEAPSDVSLAEVHARHAQAPADIQAAVQAQADQWANQNLEANANNYGGVGVQQASFAPRLTGAASQLSQSDARCVICQFLVQQLHVSLTTGVDAPAASAASADPAAPAAFLEMEAEINAAIEAEAAETGSLATEANNWLAAATAAQEHSATAAAETYFPRQLNDHGETPKRFRNPDMLAFRPSVARFNALNNPNPNADREKKRAAYQKLYTQVYSSFSSLCARRFPLAYLPYCEQMLRDYRYIAQGLHYGDRPEAICMNGNFCDAESYIRNTPHTSFRREAGDA